MDNGWKESFHLYFHLPPYGIGHHAAGGGARWREWKGLHPPVNHCCNDGYRCEWKVEGDFIFFLEVGQKDQESGAKPSRKWGKTFKEISPNLQGNHYPKT
jgi:hypothetical protein